MQQVGEVVGELLRVSSLRAEHASADNRAAVAAGQASSRELEGLCPAGDALRMATHDLVHCCLRRLEACEGDYEQEQQAGRPEEAADRLVSAAASAGHDATLLVVQEVCAELDQGLPSGGAAAPAEGKAGDLSRLAAALALAHAVAARPRTLRAAQHGMGGDAGCRDALVRGVRRVLAALEDASTAADFAPGKRGLHPSSVAAHAQHCLGILVDIKPLAAAARA